MNDQTPIEEPGGAPASADRPWYSAEGAAALAAERPKAAAGASFAGGFLLAMILRRLAR